LVGSAEERAQRRQPCTVAVVETRTLEASCITYSTFREDADEAKRFVSSVKFGRDQDEVQIDFGHYGHRVENTSEWYRLTQGKWKRVAWVSGGARADSATREKGERLRKLSIWIDQSLGRRPTLWASEGGTSWGKEFFDPNPRLRDIKLGEATVYRWRDRTGYEWTGGLVKPVGYRPGQRYPLVIQTYVFPDGLFLADGMDTTAEAAMPLASEGIAVLQIQKRFDHAITDQEAAEQLPGYEAAIDQLATDGLIDPKRVGIIGFSRGCYYVESALIKMPDRFAAATIADGSDQSYVGHRLFYPGALTQQDDTIYGVKPIGAGLAKWVSEAPGFNLDKVQAPLRIEAITPVSILMEWELYSSLLELGKPVDFVYFPNGQHILQKPLERMASQQGNVDWFRFWLQGKEDPDPAKAEQYQRWEKLCDLQRTANPGKTTYCAGTRH
jgi:hypothetical protein